MDSVELERRIQLLVEAAGFHLLSANWTPMRGRQMLRVVADAEDHNITIDECADLSRAISDLLDSYPHEFPDYRLEVSSPGLARPLKNWQLQKNIGRTVEVHYEESGVKRTYRGELIQTDEVEIQVRENDISRRFPLKDISDIYVLPTLIKSQPGK